MWLWLIVAIVFFAIGMYALGRANLHDDETLGVFWAVFFGALLWPIVIAAVLIFGPFAGLFWLGDRHRQKKEKSTDNK